MKILILGASSYLGARLYHDLRKDFEVVGTYSSSKLSDSFVHLDITNETEVLDTIKKIAPDIIVHTANNANARWCEANPDEAKRLNEISTGYIIRAAETAKAKIIYISSYAAVHPTNVYGMTKKASEAMLAQSSADWIILRPSLIIGYSPNTKNDRPFNRLLKNLDDGSKAEYDTSWKFQPTWIGHISEVINFVIERKLNKKIIPIAVQELKSRYDLANDILSPLGVVVSPIDNHDLIATAEDNLITLEQLNLPQYTYKEIIDIIIEEIKQRTTFVIL